MPLIALTGGIASGKSTIAARLAEHGAVVIDADRIVRDVQTPGSPVLSRIATEFGAGMIRPDGTLDRARLGARVFDDAEALGRLNTIVHPAVKAESQRRFAATLRADPEAIVVYDVPLLVEARIEDHWDLIVVADAPADVRAERLVRHRGFERAHARNRIGVQASDDERRAVADVLIDTSGELSDTLRQADDLWRRLQAGAGVGYSARRRSCAMPPSTSMNVPVVDPDAGLTR